MKILLIYPSFINTRRENTDVSVMPLGLYYIGALLRSEGWEVQLLNLHEPDLTAGQIKSYLNRLQPDIIGFSIVHGNRWGGLDMAALAKSLNPSVVTIFGGVGATFLWQYLLQQFHQVDYIITGEGEYAFLALIRNLAANRPCKIKDIPGVAVRENGVPLLKTPAVCLDDPDQLPQPARYFAFQHVALSRGCPENCAFCGSPRFWKRRVRFHSADYFVEQLVLLHQQGINFFYVSDDTFTLQKERVIDVCRQITERALPIAWAAISRVDRVDADILYWMRRAGCIQISYGVESGAETIRRHLNKNISETQIREAFSLTRQYGIMPRAYFIYGCPGENAQTIQASIDLMRAIQPLGMISYVLALFPGTALYDQYLARYQLTDAIWDARREDILYYETDPGLTAEAVRTFGKTLRSAFYQYLPSFVDNLQLRDEPELYPAHADFYSRLALTFSHGDYADPNKIDSPARLAERLYAQALDWHPDQRAYLGLGMLRQQQGNTQGSLDILKTGLTHFPDSESLHLCLGVSYMQSGRLDAAIACFQKFPASRQAQQHLARCHHARGETDLAAAAERQAGRLP